MYIFSVTGKSITYSFVDNLLLHVCIQIIETLNTCIQYCMYSDEMP